MLYTEKEKHEIERVKEVFAKHLRQSPDFELLWSDKVGYVWLTIGVNPVYVESSGAGSHISTSCQTMRISAKTC